MPRIFKSRKNQNPTPTLPAIVNATAAISACEFWLERGETHLQRIENNK